MKTPKVVIAIFMQENKVLVEKRGLMGFETTQYLFPGGRVENNETDEDALRREVLEELGLQIKTFYALPCKEMILGLKKQNLIPFIITSWKGIFPNQILDSGTPLFWVDLETALQSKVIPTKKIIAELKNHLS